MSGLPYVWGARLDEVARRYPADGLLSGPTIAMTRAVPVAAPVDTTWRWLCQIAVAPYSYDLLDNRGRRSPRELTPGADRLEVGQVIGVVWHLVEAVPGRQWTGLTHASAERLFGPVAVTYAAEPDGREGVGSRIVCRLVVPAATRADRLRAGALGWGDLVMMRKQLLTLARLAGASH